MLSGLNKTLFPIGVVTKFNPVNSHWYLGFQEKMEHKFGKSTLILSPRIAALLFTILILYVSKSTHITIKKIQEIRNKQDLSKDIRDLEKLGFITFDEDVITVTPKIFYYIDVEELIEKIKELKKTD